MAKTSTLYRFQIALSDIERGVYESLDLRVARHPSEDEERMVVRVLARALAHEAGLDFGRGLSTTEDAALSTKTLDGRTTTWIDVGCPSAERLHRASKAAETVIVVTTKGDAMLRKEWASRAIHRSEAIAVWRLPPGFVAQLCGLLSRHVHWYVTVNDGFISVSDGDQSFDEAIERTSVAVLADSRAP